MSSFPVYIYFVEITRICHYIRVSDALLALLVNLKSGVELEMQRLKGDLDTLRKQVSQLTSFRLLADRV